MGCPALGKQLSLSFPLCHQTTAPSRGEGNRQITQRKAEALIFTYGGLCLDAGFQKGHREMEKRGCSSTQHLPPPYVSTKKMGQRTVRAERSHGCSQLRYAHGVAAGQRGPARPPVPCTWTRGQMVDSGCPRRHLPAAGFPPLVTTADTDILLRIVHTGSAFVLASRYLALA